MLAFDVARVRNGVLELAVRPALRNALGDLQEELTDAARELGDQAFEFFAEHVKAEIPGVLAANRDALRDTAAAALKQAFAESRVEERFKRAEHGFLAATAVATVVGIVGTAVLSRAIS